MSAFNTVVSSTPEKCPHCGSIIRRRVQFKYGDTWQFDYAVGEKIRWGGNDRGRPAKTVMLRAYPEPCPVCGDMPDGLIYDILLSDNEIVDVRQGDPNAYVERNEEGYIVLDD